MLKNENVMAFQPRQATASPYKLLFLRHVTISLFYKVENSKKSYCLYFLAFSCQILGYKLSKKLLLIKIGQTL